MAVMETNHYEDEAFIRQFEVVSQAASTGKDRAEFISNPSRYAKKRGVNLNEDFANMIKRELALIERYAAVLGCDNPHLEQNGVELDPVIRRKGISNHSGAMPVAVLAAVQAASSVVQTVVAIKAAMEIPL